MIKVPFEGTVEKYQGKTLDTPIPYAGEADNYENVAELKAAGAFPNDEDILKMVNTRKLTSAKAQEYQLKTQTLKEQYEASSDYKKAQLVKAAMAAGFSAAEAEALAASKLG